MEITFARHYDYEGYSFQTFDTDNVHHKPLIEEAINDMVEHGTVDIVSILDPTIESLGDDFYLYYLAKKNLKAARDKARKTAAKRGWETRRRRAAAKNS